MNIFIFYYVDYTKNKRKSNCSFQKPAVYHIKMLYGALVINTGADVEMPEISEFVRIIFSCDQLSWM